MTLLFLCSLTMTKGAESVGSAHQASGEYKGMLSGFPELGANWPG